MGSLGPTSVDGWQSTFPGELLTLERVRPILRLAVDAGNVCAWPWSPWEFSNPGTWGITRQWMRSYGSWCIEMPLGGGWICTVLGDVVSNIVTSRGA